MPHIDAWFNTQTGLGLASRDKTVSASFDVDIVSAEDALIMWRGEPMAARIVETIPNECIRQGVDISIGDDEMPDKFTPPEPEQPPTVPGAPVSKPAPKTDAFTRRTRAAVRGQHRRLDASDAKPLQEAVQKQLDNLQALQMIREAMCYERAYGGGALLLGANDYTTDLRTPLDLKKVKSLDYLTPLEARELIPLYYYNDPRASKFGQVAIYQLVPFIIGAPVDPTEFNPRVVQIHESRLIIFSGARVSRRLMVSSGTFGWGDSVLTRCVRALRGFSSSYQNAEILLQDFAQAVYKVKGLADLIAKDPNALLNSAMSVELGRSICRAIVVDSEEDFERKSTTLAGYPDLLSKFDQYLAAVAETPLTILMGTSPAGLNATGASDIRWFYDRIASTQQNRVKPAVMRLVEVILAGMGEDPDKINHSVDFPPLWQPTEKETAEAYFTQAQGDAIYLDRDVVSPEETSLTRFGGAKLNFGPIQIDFEARAAQQAMVAPTVEAKPKPLPPLNENGPMPDGAKTPQQRAEPSREGEVD
jgi:phage-related protein (TIGR01555 family)